MFPPGVKTKRLKGFILHYTVKDETEFAGKMQKYGELNAEKYAREGKRSSWVKIHLAPVFSFLKYYIFKLGFLDGRAGFICAKMSSYYTCIKYARLLVLNKVDDKQNKI